jgi:uncharacterized protein
LISLFEKGGELMDNVKEDPVCGLHIDRSGFITSYNDQTYFFCSMECKKQFDENPERFIQKSKAATGPGFKS